MSYIQQALSHFEDSLPPELITNYFFELNGDAKPNQSELFGDFTKEIKQVCERFFTFINQSILSGEYATEGDCESLLKKIIDVYSCVQYPVIEEELQKKINETLKEGAFEDVKAVCLSYELLFQEVKSRFTVPTPQYRKMYVDPLQGRIESRAPHSFVNDLRFIKANIDVALCDHFMSYEELENFKLLRIQYELENDRTLTNQTEGALKSKCRYLIEKALFRIEVEAYKQESHHKPVEIIVHHRGQFVASHSTYDWDTFKKEYAYIRTHYEISSLWKRELEDAVRPSLSTIESTKTLKDIHRAIKYHKDISKDLSELKKIREILSNRFTEVSGKSCSRQEKYSYALALNYVMNNEFSLLCKQSLPSKKKATSVQEVKKLYDEILEVQKKTGINNFFPQTQLVQFYIHYIDEKLTQNLTSEEVTSMKELLDELDNIESIYHRNIEWSRQHLNYLFQLPEAECFIELTSNKALPKIYIASSFLLPFPKERYIQEYQKNVDKIGKHRLTLDTFSMMQKKTNMLNSLEEEFKNKEIRMIEIVGLFTTMIAFVASSVQVFIKVESTKTAMVMILSLGIVFCLFILVLVGVSRISQISTGSNRAKLGFYYWFIVIVLISLGVYVVKASSDESKSSSGQSTINRERDTINNTISPQLDEIDTMPSFHPSQKRDSIVRPKARS